MKQTPDKNNALIIPLCFLAPIIKSQFEKSKCIFLLISNEWWRSRKQKQTLFMTFDFFRSMFWIYFPIICFDLDNLKDTRGAAQLHCQCISTVLWDVGGSLFLKWHVYRPLLDNKHQLWRHKAQNLHNFAQTAIKTGRQADKTNRLRVGNLGKALPH